MLRKAIQEILANAYEDGWVIEPEAKKIFSIAGIDVPRFLWARTVDEAVRFVHKISYPVVAKAVSRRVIHKSDAGGVVVGIEHEEALTEAFAHLSGIDGCEGVLVEEMVAGIELIIGAKVDFQFGPVILMGIGGTGVEIFGDTVLRMAPLKQSDVRSMMQGLRAHRLLEGYRGSQPINVQGLTSMMMTFSELVMDLEPHIMSIDLNPVMCSAERCVIADARIMLATEKTSSQE